LKSKRKATQAHTSGFHIIYIIRKLSEHVINLTKQNKQGNQVSLIKEIAGDIIGCISLMVLFYLALFIAGVYS
jgi:hypothetical protein